MEYAWFRDALGRKNKKKEKNRKGIAR